MAQVQFTEREIETIRDDIWATLDAAQCKAHSYEDLLNLPASLFELELEEVKIRKEILRKIS